MKRILEWKPDGKRPLGRPKEKCIDKIQMKIVIEDKKATAQDRLNRLYKYRLKQTCVAAWA